MVEAVRNWTRGSNNCSDKSSDRPVPGLATTALPPGLGKTHICTTLDSPPATSFSPVMSRETESVLKPWVLKRWRIRIPTASSEKESA